MGWRVINVAVTQGSNRARRDARWTELQQCCEYIGFELVPTIDLEARLVTVDPPEGLPEDPIERKRR